LTSVRELTIDGRRFVVALSPDRLKLTLKGKRNGQELRWADLISGDAALGVSLNASLGIFAQSTRSTSRKKKSAARKQQSST